MLQLLQTLWLWQRTYLKSALNAFMPPTENPETALLTPDWMTVRENLCAAIEQAKIKLKSSED